MFTSYPTYDRYRTLKLTTDKTPYEDVYSLQTALDALLTTVIVADGVFGPITDKGVRDAQKLLGITVDGLAGGGTQQALVKREANQARDDHNLPYGLVFGQLSHESGCRVGNYSPIRDDGSWDAGVAQRNTNFYDTKESHNVPYVIDFLGEYLAAYHRLYSGVTDEQRRWELASGSWNAPAYAGRLAADEGATVTSVKPSWWPARIPYTGKAKSIPDSARLKIESYMDSATAFMKL
jgi:hypothetical protein